MRSSAHAFAVALGCAALGGCGGDDQANRDDLSIVADLAGLDRAGVDRAGVDRAAEDLEVPDAALDDGAAPDLIGRDLITPGDGGCLGTGQSCGPAENCVDCSGQPEGSACVAGACGCSAATDCPKGRACDPGTHRCSTACAGGLTCNGGCCDGAACVLGNDDLKCGATGAGCVACGLGTPTCANGSCTATCAVGMAQGACGAGFCCSPQNQCAAIGAMSCAAAGDACVDCGQGSEGFVCLNGGVCGCATQADCPPSKACVGGACGDGCDTNHPCNGGCCSAAVAGTCQPGNTGAECAISGGFVICAACTGNINGSACVVALQMSLCGCNVAADCPAGRACNGSTHQCGTACDAATACNGGCCSAAVNGTCTAGTVNGACGAGGGLCSDCANASTGHVCQSVPGGGACGCNVPMDCPNGSVCGVGKQCTTMCSALLPCNGGCCGIPPNMATGSCVSGTAPGACATGSNVCTDCTLSANGHACIPGAPSACGCNSGADCPAGTACNTTTHVCSASCGAGYSACNGGCCNGATCAGGASASACGTSGGACLDCTNAMAGRQCIAGVCGCNLPGDCGPGLACNTTTHLCQAACDQATLCSSGCCDAGACVAGTSNSACGASGGACVGCGAGTPTCASGVCSDACSGLGNGTCDGGFCCSGGHCAAGNQPGKCGYSGACSDCTGSASGHKCETQNGAGPWVCGCDAATDCPAAVQNIFQAGQACDTNAHTCTDSCGAGNLTGCNGGCCSGTNGTCRSGARDGTCGNSGGFCANCSGTCSPGPVCVNGAGCGCSNDPQCFSLSCGGRNNCSQGACK